MLQDSPASRVLLESYLRTVSGPDPEDPSPAFSLPRNRDVDLLLYRWAFEGRRVAGELTGALRRTLTVDGAVDGRFGSGARRAARVHPFAELGRRLEAYIEGLWEDRVWLGMHRPDRPSRLPRFWVASQSMESRFRLEAAGALLSNAP